VLVVVPAIGLVGYTGFVALQEFIAVAGPGLAETVLARFPGNPESVRSVAQSPGALLDQLEDTTQLRAFVERGLGLLGTGANAVFHLTLALSVAFFLLRDGPRLTAWFRDDIADDDGITTGYLTAVDADLGTVYFGNVLTVLAVGLTSLVVYHGFNLVAPTGLTIPFPTLLGLLTGLATFIPLVVGKVVYVPITGLLAYQASQSPDGGLFVWVGVFFVVAVLSLDLVPQTFVRPYISGQSLHPGLVLFAYVLGAALFGWYGLFLGPLLAVLIVQAANVVLPELLHGERLSLATYTDIGSEPEMDDEQSAGTSAGSDEAEAEDNGDSDEQEVD
jgi:predicted PurR-regulated permease PerM